MEATARIFFQKAPAKKTKDDLCPVKLCITHRRDRRYYSINKKIKQQGWLFLSESDILKVTADSPRSKYRDMAFEYKRIVDEAQEIINSLPQFSFNLFEEVYLNKVKRWDNVFSAMVDHIISLKDEGRIGYASSFESTLRAIKEFHENKSLNFNCRKEKVESRYEKYCSGKSLYFIDITDSWLKRFETWLIKNDKGSATAGIYVRNIRTLFNLAIKEHKVKAENPFPNHKPKDADGRKIALNALQINLIANFKTEHPKELFYRDIFMFSFLGNGMNLSDIARLRYSDIDSGELVFIRKKTKTEKGKEEKLHVPITNNMQAIIDRNGNKAVGFDSYIFPILKPEWDEVKIYAEIKQLTKQVNKYVGQIAKKAGINEKVTSYVARHSWATIAKNSGTSVEYISEALGHSSVIVTKIYLGSFESAARKEQSGKIEDAVYNQKAV